jgi:hypothetical protein
MVTVATNTTIKMGRGERERSKEVGNEKRRLQVKGSSPTDVYVIGIP